MDNMREELEQKMILAIDDFLDYCIVDCNAEFSSLSEYALGEFKYLIERAKARNLS